MRWRGGPVQAALSEGVVSGDAAAVARLDGTVRHEVLGKVVVGVKLRLPDGPYVYSSDPGVVGTNPALDAEDSRPLLTGRASADFSRLAEPDDAYERATGAHLIEVYDAVRTPGGRRLLLEAYVSLSSVRSARGIFLRSLPALVRALVLLAAVQLPLASSPSGASGGPSTGATSSSSRRCRRQRPNAAPSPTTSMTGSCRTSPA